MAEITPQPNGITSDLEVQGAQPARHDAHWFFFGPHGLRAGWSVVIFILLFLGTELLLGWTLRPLIYKMSGAQHAQRVRSGPLQLPFAYLMEAVQLAGVFVATLVMALLERRSPFSYGYRGRLFAVRFVSGLMYGFLAISILVAALWKTGFLVLSGQLLHGMGAWQYAAGWAGFFILVGLTEESLLRGYLQYTLTRGIGFWWGALLFSFLFGFLHGSNPGETPVGLFSAGAIGLAFCLSLWYTGSLFWAVGFHVAWDWGESYFWGTSDSGMIAKGHLFGEHPVGRTLWSGGATGPEGSLFVFPLILLVALCMHLWWRSRSERPFAAAAWKPMARPLSAEDSPALRTLGS